MITNRIRKPVGNLILAVTVCALGLACERAAAEREDAAPKPEKVTRLYRLRHADPSRLTATFQIVAPDAKLAADARGSSLIVQATAEEHAQIEELIEELDVLPEKSSDDEMRLRAFRLEHAEPRAVLKVLQETMTDGTVRISLDERTNTVLVFARGTTQEKAEELIRLLDVAEESLQLKIFQLTQLPADSAMQILQQLFRGQMTGMSFDPESNSLLVYGTEDVLQVVEAILQRLDSQSKAEPSDAPAATRFEIRIVWLVAGADDGAPKLSEALASVAKQLETMGFRDLHEVGSVIVSAGADGDFQIGALPKVGQAQCEWNIEGKLRAQAKAVQLEIEMAATRRIEMKDSEGNVRGIDVERILEIRTATTLPLNQPVLLGATPLGEATSVAIIQVLPKSG